jgi:hypothetical protein
MLYRTCSVQIGRLADAVVPALIVTISLSFGTSAWGQTQAATGGAFAGSKLQAELLKTIDAGRARVGDEVTARTVTPLEFNGAKIPTGAIVQGHVAEAEETRLLLVFDRIGADNSTPLSLRLSLRAVMMPRAAMIPQPSSDAQLSPRAQAGGGNTGVDTQTRRGDMLRSPEAAARDSSDTIFEGSRSVPVSPRTVETRNGGVIGLPGVQLVVSTDPKAGATFQTEKNHKLKLEKGLQLMFMVSN